MPVLGNVLAAYADQATDYERRTALYQEWRELLVEQLPLCRGDVVLDVGCGTGLCFELLQRKIGTTGTIIGIDEAPAMLDTGGSGRTPGWRRRGEVAGPLVGAPARSGRRGARPVRPGFHRIRPPWAPSRRAGR